MKETKSRRPITTKDCLSPHSGPRRQLRTEGAPQSRASVQNEPNVKMHKMPSQQGTSTKPHKNAQNEANFDRDYRMQPLAPHMFRRSRGKWKANKTNPIPQIPIHRRTPFHSLLGVVPSELAPQGHGRDEEPVLDNAERNLLSESGESCKTNPIDTFHSQLGVVPSECSEPRDLPFERPTVQNEANLRRTAITQPYAIQALTACVLATAEPGTKPINRHRQLICAAPARILPARCHAWPALEMILCYSSRCGCHCVSRPNLWLTGTS